MIDRFKPWEKAGPHSSSNFRRRSVLIRFNAFETRKGEKLKLQRLCAKEDLCCLSHLVQILPLAT